jgi:GNAT superfamily N-acetyltransferase
MGEMNLVFAEITEADLPELTGVMTRAFDDDAKKHFGKEKGGPPGYDNGEFFQEWLFGYQWTVGYKAILDNRIVGATIVWIFDTGNNILGTIFVDPEYQNRGVGARMWAFIESTYANTKSWQLETPSLATKNHHFYEKCGFQRVEVKPTEGDMPGESWVYKKDVL